MKESNFQSIFSKHMRENPPAKSAVCELKLEKSGSILFSRVKTHQEIGLLSAKVSGYYHKISDAPFGHSSGFRFHSKKDFDCLFIAKPEAYVVLLFYKPRKPKECIFIDIHDWLHERDVVSKRKSLTEKRAREISSKIITI